MKLLFLTPQLPFPPRQGTTIRNFNLIRWLAPHHTIDLLTFLAPGETLRSDSPLHGLCRRIATVAQPERSTAVRARATLLSAAPDMALRLESAEMHRLVAAWTAAERYDIVQFEGIELAQYGRGAASGANRPALVFDDHNCEYLLQQRNALTDLRTPRRWVAAGYSLVQWQKLRRYEAATVRQADATIAVSDADRAALLAVAPGAAITVAANGIDPLEYDPLLAKQANAEPPRLVFTGKMDYRPNIDAVLWFAETVLPRVAAVEPAVRFQVVGLNPHPRLDALRRDPHVEIVGAVEDVRPFIAAAAAYVIPMRVGGGTRFKALEAMASGAAIVSTSLGVEGIDVSHQQEMLLEDTPEAFSSAVLRLIGDLRGDGTLRRRLGATARSFVEAHYDWRQIVPRLEAVYDQLIAQDRSP
jgi:sugar transferase (PEP-CTERM/EpsH1 system associated)